jgi:hypothetical protein
MVCHEGEVLQGGTGECPTGRFCPHQNHTGILCPPRHYCPSRGNIKPIRCPKGTFNMHFGQSNCTACTIGKICPMEAMLVPEPCPPGYICNDQRLVTPELVCRPGHICLGGVESGTRIMERSC